MAKTSFVGTTAEYVSHVNGARFRINGVGELKMKLYSLDNARTYDMKPLTMSMTPGIEPTRLANFKSQRTLLEVKTTEMFEFMRVSRIIVFMKPSATSLPM